MVRYALVALLALQLCLIGVHGTATGATGCDTTNCTTSTDVCESNTCKLPAGGDCSGGSSGFCKSATTCESDVCKVDAGGSCAAPNAANCVTGTTCESDVCMVTCTTDADCTVANTACTGEGAGSTKFCQCKSGYKYNSDNTACEAESGATSVVSSVVVLLTALVTTSRLF